MKLTHLDENNTAHMVDISNKDSTQRIARAKSWINISYSTMQLITHGNLPKGDALSVARIAGIMAAKRTSELIPLCHPIPINSIKIDFTLKPTGIFIEATVLSTAPTGVEMEALTAVSVTALTIYDMIKSLERETIIEKIKLEEKSGGKSGSFYRKKTIP